MQRELPFELLTVKPTLVGAFPLEHPRLRCGDFHYGPHHEQNLVTMLARQLERQLTLHRNQVLRWLRKVEHVELHEVDYAPLVRESKEQVRCIR